MRQPLEIRPVTIDDSGEHIRVVVPAAAEAAAGARHIEDMDSALADLDIAGDGGLEDRFRRPELLVAKLTGEKPPSV